MASPSPEKDNFLRIAALLVDGGAKLLRSIIDSIHTPASLSTALADPKTKKELKKARISGAEWNKLYPSAGGQVKSEDLDITLLSKVLRHVCNLPTPPAGWDKLPNAAHQSPSDDLVRIRIHRNEAVAHATEMKLDNVEFQRLWNEISGAMIRLAKRISTAEETKWKALTEQYLSGPLTCEEEDYAKDLESWCKRDRLLEEEMRAGFEDLGEGITALSQQMSRVEKLVSYSQEKPNDASLDGRADSPSTSDKIKIGDIEYQENQVSLLGKGCLGTVVYKGKLVSSSRDVAVKKMYKGNFDAGEAATLRTLKHPNIIKCFELGEDKDHFYLALELCVKTLTLCVKENDFQRKESGLDRLECLKEVTGALVYLHDYSICHRDIKPDNILLAFSNPPRFVVADLNIAKHEGSVASMTVNVAGTPGYIAHEIYEGDARLPAKADVFSLGCVFYFVLTNMRHPFGSYKDLKTCQANIRKAMQPMLLGSNFREHVWIMQIIERMIKHDPVQRPDAKDVLQILEGIKPLEFVTESDGTVAIPSSERNRFGNEATVPLKTAHNTTAMGDQQKVNVPHPGASNLEEATQARTFPLPVTPEEQTQELSAYGTDPFSAQPRTFPGGTRDIESVPISYAWKEGVPSHRELDDVAKYVVGCWQSVGLGLGLEQYEIDGILHDNVTYYQPRQKAFRMLQIWHDRGRSSTYASLAGALCYEGKEAIAQKYCQALNGKGTPVDLARRDGTVAVTPEVDRLGNEANVFLQEHMDGAYGMAHESYSAMHSAQSLGFRPSPFVAYPSEELVNVADDYMGCVIGLRGCIIKEIKAVTGARIDTVRGQGFMVKGSPSQIERARTEILEKVEKAQQEEEIVAVDKDHKAYVIGSGGMRIKQIKAASGAAISTRDEGFLLRGSPEQRKIAKELILEKVDENQRRKQHEGSEQSVQIPEGFEGAVLGIGGKRIQEISKRTGAKIILTGSEEAKDKARVEIKRAVHKAKLMSENSRVLSCAFVDDLNLPDDCTLRLTPAGNAQQPYLRYRLRTEKEPQRPGGGETADNTSYLPDLKKSVIECLQEVKQQSKPGSDMWVHLGTVLLKVQEEDISRDWTLEEARDNLAVNPLESEEQTRQSRWQSSFVGADFKQGSHLDGRLQEHPYATRYDLTFLTPSYSEARCKVWIKSKGHEDSQHGIPYSDFKNVIQEFAFKDKKTNDRCKGWLCFPSVKRLRADIAFPGCDLDCRLTIRRRELFVGDVNPSEKEELKTLVEYLSLMTLNEDDENDVLPLPKVPLPENFDLEHRRCSERALYTYNEEFTAIFSKECYFPSKSQTNIERKADLHLHCNKWDEMLRSEQWQPEDVVDKLPEFMEFVRSMQQIVAPHQPQN